MRVRMLVAAVALAASLPFTPASAGPSIPGVQTSSPAIVVLQNARVRVYRAIAGALAGVDHRPGVVVWLEEHPARAIWLDDAGIPPAAGAGRGPVVIVQPLEREAPSTTPPASGSAPGAAPFTGMSFVPLFDNARVSVLRARMEVDAREGLHTHGSDTLVVHLSGGEIEDTAEGKTIVNRWAPGDVEFEARGSSHSARNVGHAVDVILVALKP